MDIEDINSLTDSIMSSVPDYTSNLQDLSIKINESNDILKYILCFLFIFSIFIVCRFAYKHFNQFFQ